MPSPLPTSPGLPRRLAALQLLAEAVALGEGGSPCFFGQSSSKLVKVSQKIGVRPTQGRGAAPLRPLRQAIGPAPGLPRHSAKRDGGRVPNPFGVGISIFHHGDYTTHALTKCQTESCQEMAKLLYVPLR